eukprot:scaffold45401_cov63-Phaeocystis_antarctica.AAC.3
MVDGLASNDGRGPGEDEHQRKRGLAVAEVPAHLPKALRPGWSRSSRLLTAEQFRRRERSAGAGEGEGHPAPHAVVHGVPGRLDTFSSRLIMRELRLRKG